MSIIEEIRSYEPSCMQEEQDQLEMLHYLSLFDNLLLRENSIAHFTSSSFIVNSERTKTLVIFHKIYQAWCWPGGHMDGETDFMKVALKEAEEETGIREFKIVSKDIASLDIIPVLGHLKNERWVSSHQHLSLAYLIEAKEETKLIQNEAETLGLTWMSFEELLEKSREPEMIPIYKKLIRLAKTI